MDISPLFIPVMAQAWAELYADPEALEARVGNTICKRIDTTNKLGVHQDYQLAELLLALLMVIEAVALNKPLPIGKLQRVACVNSRVYEFDAAKYAVWGDLLASTIGDSYDGTTRFNFLFHVVAFLSQFLEILLRLSQDEVLLPEPERCPFRQYRNSSLILELPSENLAILIFSDDATISTEASEPSTPPPPSTMIASKLMLNPQSLTPPSRLATPKKSPSNKNVTNDSMPPKSTTPKSKIRRSTSHASLQRFTSLQPPTSHPLNRSLSRNSTMKTVSVKLMKALVCEPTELQGANDDDTYDMINCFDIHQVDAKAKSKKKKNDCVIT